MAGDPGALELLVVSVVGQDWGRTPWLLLVPGYRQAASVVAPAQGAGESG